MTRNDDHRMQLMLAATASVAVALLLILVKALAWVMTGSVSLLASLIDSVMDSLASLINFAAVRYALVPADAEHRFGHGKAEALAGLGQALLIAVSSLLLIWKAGEKLLEPRPIEDSAVGIAVMVFSIIVTALLVLLQRRVIRRTGSTAIQADALHYAGDLAMNLSIIVVLFLSGLGFDRLDGIAGLLIALLILYSSARIGWQSMQILLDRELPGEVRDGISALVAADEQALGFHDLRTRRSGQTWFVQLHVDMDRDLPLHEAHAMGERIRGAIRRRYPQAEVIIHHDPVSKAAQVPVIAQQQGGDSAAR